MKTLILLRHAKSSWGDPMLSDHARPLNKRGRRAVPVIAAWLTAQGYLPDHLHCSSSERTRETARLLAEAMPGLPDPMIEETLYHAPAEVLLRHLRALPASCETALVIGHEPGLSTLCARLAAPAVPTHCQAAFTHFPTAAAAIFRLDEAQNGAAAWTLLTEGTAKFVDFAKPRDLVSD